MICEVMHEMQCGHRLLFRHLKCLRVFIGTALIELKNFNLIFKNQFNVLFNLKTWTIISDFIPIIFGFSPGIANFGGVGSVYAL